ncbi:PREDICTED: uncharacterized protein LOC106150089 isoform X3 [Chinchilla lanigera]|uniref:uncharacterized protein LOC106150089 isoform X3 n=1 Tax=Chinchilla lanigera TaxID=34839 RepID=UPI00069611D8|nr:PREDICTED: uncharacterized protein LOC106150089 isoform X3 [Chinchilla lanigera]
MAQDSPRPEGVGGGHCRCDDTVAAQAAGMMAAGSGRRRAGSQRSRRNVMEAGSSGQTSEVWQKNRCIADCGRASPGARPKADFASLLGLEGGKDRPRYRNGARSQKPGARVCPRPAAPSSTGAAPCGGGTTAFLLVPILPSAPPPTLLPATSG